MKFLALLCFGICAISSALADDVRVTSIDAFLIYGHTGKLSENIADPNTKLEFWNTIAGDASALEPSSDVLIITHFSRARNKTPDEPVSIRVVDYNSREVLGQREALSLAFIDSDLAAQSMLLHNVTCNHLEVSAMVGQAKTLLDLPFDCGE